MDMAAEKTELVTNQLRDFRRNAMGQPSISYKVIRRFISSKEFETPFGLRLLANTLNDIIHSDGTSAPTLTLRKKEPDSDPRSSDLSDNTVLYDMASSKDLKKELDRDKKTFFSSSSSSDSLGSSSECGRRRRKVEGDRRTREKTEKNKSSPDGADKELQQILRMTDYNPSGRAESGDQDGNEKGKEKSNSAGLKEKKEEMSLLDCLDAAECVDECSNPESEVRESGVDFLSVMNSEMKSAFLQSSDNSGSDCSEEEEKLEAEAEKRKTVEGGTKEKSKSKARDELSKYRLPSMSKSDEASEKSGPEGEDPPLSDEDSSCSVEYVEQVRKVVAGRDDSKSEPTSDSGSDIQQVYCKAKSPSLSPTKGRKNINKILKKDSLQVETKQALKIETERKKRVSERMKLYEKLFPNTQAKFILDFDPHTKKELVVVDSGLSGQLKPHQKEGVRFMWNCCFESLKRLEEDSGSGCVLAHCMGLGKTLQVITLVHTILTQSTGVRTVMIMCPLNTLRNWSHEFKSWQRGCEKKIKPVDLIPSKTKHSRIARVRIWSRNGGVLLISYEMFRSLVKKDCDAGFGRGFLDPGPDLVVCDEGHVLKNNNSALSKLISRIRTRRRIILTGTPLQNNLIEYYCMVQFVKPNILGTKREFLNRFVNPINNGQFEDSTQLDVRLMKRRAHVLHTMLDGFIQRRGYYVLKPFLPEKQEYVISIALTETQENIYRLFIGRCTQESSGLLKDFHWMQKVWTHPRVMLTHARKNRGSEEAVPDQWERLVREEDHDSIESSGKLVLLFSILKRCKEIGDKVLVFSQSLYSLDLIEHFLRKAHSCHCSGAEVEFADRWVLGQDYFRLDGSTSSDNRDAYCQGFNSVEDGRARLFLISTRAGGLGINLVAANRVVVFDASWNPTHDVQSIFRVYRFGQKKMCYIYRFLAAATMEEKIYKRQVTKLSLAHRILDEHQIERHYTMGNLQDLYRYDPLPKSEWRVPKVPKDDLFADILSRHRDIIVAYHEHDSLLENKEEEELTEEERRAAWEDYEKEKLTPQHPRTPLNGGPLTLPPIAPKPSAPWLNAQGLRGVPSYGAPPAGAQPSFISNSDSDLCKIVEVRTLNKGGGAFGGVQLAQLLEFSEAFGLRRAEGEDLDKFCERALRAYVSVFPWGRAEGVRGGMRGAVGV